jgi:hypothetical protein
VEVHERLDGTLAVVYQGETLASKEAPPGPALLRARTSRRTSGSSPGTNPQMQGTLLRNGVHHPEESGRVPDSRRQSPQAGQNPVRARPAPNHPWRRPLLTKSLNN